MRKPAARRVYFYARKSYIGGTPWMFPECPADPGRSSRILGYYAHWRSSILGIRR